MKHLFLVIVIAVVFYSCKRDTVEPATVQNYLDYFPVTPGTWAIYDVDSVLHLTDDDATNEPDTSIAAVHFQIKEIVGSSFIDGQGNTAYYVTRYKRYSDTLDWTLENVWTQNVTFNSAQRVEDNVRYVKLSFPINQNTPQWNGNAYNNLGEEDYGYTDIHVPSTVGSLSFDSTVTVLQLLDDNLIHQIFKEEKYANHVGLIYKENDNLNINGIGQVTNGIEFREKIISYGK